MPQEAAEYRELTLRAARLIEEKNAREITILEVGKVSVIADYFIIATGGSKVQLHTICDFLKEELKAEGIAPVRIEGYREGWWIVLDYGFMIIHLFQPESREFYNIERLWADARQVTSGGV